MGMPLSRFTQLAEVVNNPENKSQLTQFKIYCILLHNFKDKLFEKYVKSNFLSLDEAIGESMLFMSFFNPPETWVYETDCQKASRRNLCCELVTNEE